ncbi:LysR family transcriptional regulator [Sphingomonas sp.]|uniref:LysR family transcriptional regulator n=1 Tax=Sphingomonas sp. TaxID=28214 RepID=UPI0031D1740E
MRPTIEELQTFVRVVETGGVAAAARRMNLAKSVVSKRLRDLETALQTDLFLRVGRRLQPTDAGLIAYEDALPILSGVDRLVEDAMAQTSRVVGIIRMAAPHSFGQRRLAPIVFDFMTEHRGIEVHLELDDRRVDLRAGGFDLAVRIGPVDDEALAFRPIGLSPARLYASPAYASSRTMPTDPRDLADHHCLAYNGGGGPSPWRFETTGKGQSFALSPTTRLQTNGSEALVAAAIAGLGITRLPDFLADDAVAAGQLQIVDMPDWSLPGEPINVIWPRKKRMKRAASALLNTITGIFDQLSSAPHPPKG